jgi:hypothetical protein
MLNLFSVTRSGHAAQEQRLFSHSCRAHPIDLGVRLERAVENEVCAGTAPTAP